MSLLVIIFIFYGGKMDKNNNINIKKINLKNQKIRLVFDNKDNILYVNNEADNKPNHLFNFEVFSLSQ
jgi:hypothetical protein